MAAVIFLGPSLPQSTAREIAPDAHYLPPARQGDLYRAVRSIHPDVVGVIDGGFLSSPAVWHREILWTLSQGVHVIGAASMGALRAAELADFGMVGIGKIFSAFRDGRYPPFDDPFEDDDEVAIVHAPAEIGGASISDAMVDLRETAARAEADGLIQVTTRDDLVRAMKSLHFAERSFARLIDAARAMLTTRHAEAFADWLRSNRVSQKALDAAGMLRFVAGGTYAPLPSFTMERALVWEHFLAREECAPKTEEELALCELGLDPAAWRSTEQVALGRMAALDGVSIPNPDLQATLNDFRRMRGLTTRAALEVWLEENALTEPEVLRLMRDEATLAGAASGRLPRNRLRRAMVDHLRLSGTFAPLLARARRKEQALEMVQSRPSSIETDGAMVWYFERRLRLPMPKSFAAHAEKTGHRDEATFRKMVWDEYLFARREGGGR